MKRIAIPIALLLAAAAAAGCGRDEADLVNGKELFVQKCGSCHVLQRAGTRGVQGPSLDAAFAAARRDGFSADTIRGVVRDQIANPRRGSIMPGGLVKGDDAKDVATYVGQVAAVRGEDQGALASAGQPEVSNKPIPEENGVLEIAANPTGALAFASTRASANAGQIELVMPNEASIQHNIAVKDGGFDERGPVVGQGGTSRLTVDLEPGEYTFYCSVPGHEAGGMKGELTVK